MKAASDRNPGVAQRGTEFRRAFGVESATEKTSDFRGLRIEPLRQGFRRVANAREFRVQVVEAHREGVLGDFAGDLLGAEVECVGERPIQVFGELKGRRESLDEEVLGLRRNDAVRVDTVVET